MIFSGLTRIKHTLGKTELAISRARLGTPKTFQLESYHTSRKPCFSFATGNALLSDDDKLREAEACLRTL